MKNLSENSRRMFIKTVMAAAGGIVVGGIMNQPLLASAQSYQGNLEKIPMAKRWAISTGGYIYFQIKDDKALLEKVGQEKYTEMKKEMGLKVGARNKKRAEEYGFTGNDARSVAAMAAALVSMYYGPNQKFEIVDAAAEKASVTCSKCAYWDALQAQKITDDLCSTWSQYWWEGFVTAMNPKLSLKLTKARPRGDSLCEWHIANKA